MQFPLFYNGCRVVETSGCPKTPQLSFGILGHPETYLVFRQTDEVKQTNVRVAQANPNNR
jgi:hypothetical protein